eukprot:jgi/Tetstr1/437839/TSEL_026479.t1
MPPPPTSLDLHWIRTLARWPLRRSSARAGVGVNNVAELFRCCLSGSTNGVPVPRPAASAPEATDVICSTRERRSSGDAGGPCME